MNDTSLPDLSPELFLPVMGMLTNLAQTEQNPFGQTFMDWSDKWNFGLLLLLLSTLCSCSREENAKTLARRLGEADRVTIADKYPDPRNFTMPLTAQETKSLVQAISTAKRESPLITATADWRIEFFKGTNLVGSFNVGAGVFWIDHGPDPDRLGLRRTTPYSDNTRMLNILSEKFRIEKAAAQTPTNSMAR